MITTYSDFDSIQYRYDLSTPTEHPLNDTCSELSDAIHDAMQKAGFDVDGVDVEPDGEFHVTVSCSPFPSLALCEDKISDMVCAYVHEIRTQLLGAM